MNHLDSKFPGLPASSGSSGSSGSSISQGSPRVAKSFFSGVADWMRGESAPDAQLRECAMHGDVLGARAALAKGANINGNGVSDPPLIHALSDRRNLGRLAVALDLLSAGADPNSRTFEDGIRPLHLAAQAGWAQGVQALIQRGADVEARTDAGLRPLDFAMHETASMAALMEHGANINAHNDRGQTVLHRALSLPDLGEASQLARELVSMGADLSVREAPAVNGKGVDAVPQGRLPEEIVKHRLESTIDYGEDGDAQLAELFDWMPQAARAQQARVALSSMSPAIAASLSKARAVSLSGS